ncbi:hypothetical protein ABMA27_005711 [Loxostege sticticalis]|uniref:Arrestin C-terminal-like domain-containing protein n=1 Tax=Loxostege sticticalis TaxID=481309 RepID=A0ABR3HK43_LOXSC
MGYEEGQIILDSSTGAYYAGQDVNGRVVFELTKRKKVRGIYVKIKGFCSVHWTTQESRRRNDRTEHYTVNHDSHEEYFNVKTYVLGGKNAEHNLEPGKHEYLFNFQIPQNVPSSFEGQYGHVRYELKAVADRPFKIDQEIHHPLRVMEPLDLNQENCKDPVEFEFDQSYCCWCMSAGSSHTLVKMPVTGYCPGQTIPLEVSCNNTSTVEVDAIKFAIKKHTEYRAVDAPGTKYEADTILEVRKGPIPGNTERNWTVELEVPEMDIYNLNSCSYIDIRYIFKVTIEVSGCHSNKDDACNLIFGTIPLVGFEGNLPALQNQLPQTTFPVPNGPYPPPIVNQPIATSNNFQGVNSPYPGPNPPYPNASPYPAPSPYPSPNPPYPGVSPLPNNPPYPGSNPPYPNASPYPGANPPYPNSTPVQGNPPYPNGAPNPSPNPPYPNSPGQNPPYPNSSPYPGANPPYPNSTPVHGNPPYPNGAPNPSPNAPYPNSTPEQSNLPYPNATPIPGSNPPYPGASPYPKNPSPSLGGGLRTGNMGFIGVQDPASVPLLPPGAGVPYPPTVTSPYATASAPEPSTPGSEQKKLEDNPNNSPYNPEFINKN